MSKQVELQGQFAPYNLLVRTRLDYSQVTRVIVMRQGETARVFYPFRPNELSENDINDMRVCGYQAKELVVLATALNHKGIDEIDIKAFNDCYLAGYKRAMDEFNSALENSVQQIINGAKAEVQLSGNTQNN